MKERQEALQIKLKAITRMGTPVFYGPTLGAILRDLGDYRVRISLSAQGVNWVDEVHIDKLSLTGPAQKAASTSGEFYEKVDTSCEGGGCTI